MVLTLELTALIALIAFLLYQLKANERDR